SSHIGSSQTNSHSYYGIIRLDPGIAFVDTYIQFICLGSERQTFDGISASFQILAPSQRHFQQLSESARLQSSPASFSYDKCLLQILETEDKSLKSSSETGAVLFSSLPETESNSIISIPSNACITNSISSVPFRQDVDRIACYPACGGRLHGAQGTQQPVMFIIKLNIQAKDNVDFLGFVFSNTPLNLTTK
ncbi:MAG: hypothetical protein EZS28_040046, partial [Streblomastix strix]